MSEPHRWRACVLRKDVGSLEGVAGKRVGIEIAMESRFLFGIRFKQQTDPSDHEYWFAVMEVVYQKAWIKAKAFRRG